MRTQFNVLEVSVLPNDIILVAGTQRGDALSVGKRGRATTQWGEVDVEIVSIAIVDPQPQDPAKQLLRVHVHGGSAQALKGVTLFFE